MDSHPMRLGQGTLRFKTINFLHTFPTCHCAYLSSKHHIKFHHASSARTHTHDFPSIWPRHHCLRSIIGCAANRQTCLQSILRGTSDKKRKDKGTIMHASIQQIKPIHGFMVQWNNSHEKRTNFRIRASALCNLETPSRSRGSGTRGAWTWW